MEKVFKDRALLCSRYYKPSSLLEYYFPKEISNSPNLISTTVDEKSISIKTKILQKVKSRGDDIASEKKFSTDETRLMFFTPCGYEKATLKTCRRAVNCFANSDARALVSLALFNANTPFLQDYANKLPLMCVNVRRFKYTVQAFEFASQHMDLTGLCREYNGFKSDLVTLGLNFIIKSDLKTLDLKHLPNLRFSNFLHRLKLSGSITYIFSLAKNLHYDVDLLYIDKQNLNDVLSVFRYKLSKNPNNNKSIGVLTAVYVKSSNLENEWYVFIHSKPLLNFES